MPDLCPLVDALGPLPDGRGTDQLRPLSDAEGPLPDGRGTDHYIVSATMASW